MQRAVREWLDRYEAVSSRFAACHYVESIGTGRIASHARAVADEHDRSARADSDLPLA